MKIKYVVIFFLGLSFASAGHANEVLIPNDPTGESFILKFELQAMPYVELKDPTPQATEEGLKIQSTEGDFNVFIPEINIGEDSLLHQKFDFSGLYIQSQHFDVVNPQEIGHLYGMSYQGEAIIPVGADWNVRGRLTPGFFTDAEGSSKNNFKMQGGASIDKTFDRGALGVGAIYTNALGRPLLLPTVSLVYKDPPYLVEGELPLSLSGWIKASGSTFLGLTTRIHGNQYGVNKADSIYEGNLFEYSVWTVGPGVRYDMGEMFLQLDLGYTLRRKMRVTDKGATVLDFTPDNTWYISGTVQFKP